MIPSPVIEAACVACGARAARYKRTPFGGPSPSACARCGEPVAGDVRATVLGPLPGPGEGTVTVALVVCSECAVRCPECAGLRSVAAVPGLAAQAQASTRAVPRGGVAPPEISRTTPLPRGRVCAVCRGSLIGYRADAQTCRAPSCRRRAHREREREAVAS